MSTSLSQYQHQKIEVEDLLRFHAQLPKGSRKSGKAKRGRRADNLQVLHKAAVIVLTACWEAYVEGILLEATQLIAGQLNDPAVLPERLRASIAKTTSKKLEVSKDNELYPWYFVGDGWRTILLRYAQLQVSELNTPDASGLRKYFSLLLGIDDITLAWGRPGKSASDAADKLDEHLSDRHVIAHGASAEKKFTKGYVTKYRSFLDKTVEKTEEAVRQRLSELGLSLP